MNRMNREQMRNLRKGGMIIDRYVMSVLRGKQSSRNMHTIQGVPKNLLESGEQYIVVSRFSSVFSRCLTRGVINAATILIVLFKFYN